MNTADWMKELAVGEVVNILTKAKKRFTRAMKKGDDRFKPALEIILQDLSWLKERDDNKKIFSARDWTAFQLIGLSKGKQNKPKFKKERKKP